MKVRLHCDSIRLRLLQPEARQLAIGNEVTNETGFSQNAALVCRLLPDPAIDRVVVSLTDNQIIVRVPQSTLLEWYETDAISIESEQAIADGRSLHLLIEKDFQCTERGNGADADAFPRPAGRQTCAPVIRS